MKKLFDFMRYNYIQMNKGENEIIKMPIALFIVFLLFGFKALLLLMGISLFFNFTYHLTGQDDMTSINTFLEKLNRVVMHVKSEF